MVSVYGDPTSGFKFQVNLRPDDGSGVISLGFSRVTGLEQAIEEVTYREGTDTATVRKLPGLVTYPPLVLERGLTTDKRVLDWAKQVADFSNGLGGGAGGSSVGNSNAFRGEIQITLYDRGGDAVMQFSFFKAWIRRFAIGDLDAASSQIIINTAEFCHEGMIME